jgi:long-chain acyl-CoA synthetase
MTQATPQALLEPTLCAAFQRTASERPEQVALRTLGGTVSFTWKEYQDRVRRYAAGLAGLGVVSGDTVAFLLTNRPEFNLLDAAAMHLGAVSFSIYNTSAPEQIHYVLSDSGARLVITELAFVERLRQAACGTAIEKIVLVDGQDPGALTLEGLEAAAPAGFDFEAAWRAVTPDTLLTIIYTSGTTGPPKGVELTHDNMMAQLRAFQAVRPLEPAERVISFLPHAHVADRWGTHYSAMIHGSTITSCPDPKRLFEHVLDARPTQFGGVPRVWEKLKAALEARFAAAPEERRAAILGALEAARAKVRSEQAGHAVGDELAAAVARAEQAVFRPLREMLGLGDARQFYVGAAPMLREVVEFFHAIGMPVVDMWGMSELSGAATLMPMDRIKIGTVGKAMPGVEIRTAADGEVLVRGSIVMRGYRNMPEATARTIDPDGWLATGDIGEIDEEGFVRLIDRKKELIINAAGKNMSPANIEARLKASSPLIGQACVVGDGRPFNVALLVLDPDGAAQFAHARGIGADLESLPRDSLVLREIERAVAEANSHLSRVEQIKYFDLLAHEWLPGGDELTPTMKLKRKPILAKYAAEIDALYSRASQDESTLLPSVKA